MQVKTPVKQLKNSLAKKVVRPREQNHKWRLAGTAESLRGAQPRLGAEQAWGGQVTEQGSHWPPAWRTGRWDTTGQREKTADLGKHLPQSGFSREREPAGGGLGQTELLHRICSESRKLGSPLLHCRQARRDLGKPTVHFQAKDSLPENFFLFGLDTPVFLVYPGLQVIGQGPPTPCKATYFTQSPPI